jgi:predicted ribosome quality control (RQC) complex YloA/Tae2 family protein
VEIRLKKDLSIPENAERLYRKSRGKQADLERVQKNLSAWKEKAQELRSALLAVADCKDLKSLRKLVPAKEKPSNLQEDSDLPFHLIHFLQYEIRIGKNAKGNDELLRISHKDDHWLHARDVAGSHVLVRKRKGQNTPAPVLERAAELAAYYSRGRNESLCPVMLTERKYVRKIKGSAAGLVKVEREKTLLVSPKG